MAERIADITDRMFALLTDPDVEPSIKGWWDRIYAAFLLPMSEEVFDLDGLERSLELAGF